MLKVTHADSTAIAIIVTKYRFVPEANSPAIRILTKPTTMRGDSTNF
jgi:hypothetical protein